jgi:hypothetical protein
MDYKRTSGTMQGWQYTAQLRTGKSVFNYG